VKRATRRLSLLTIMLAPAAALAAPIGLETALPIARDEYLVRTQFMDLERSAISGPAEVSAQAMMAALGYGFSPRLAGFAVLPWLNKELKMPAATRRAEGLGDLMLFARYTLHQDDAPGRTFRIAPVLGVTAPTGEDDDTDTLGRLPRALQTGSGSWAGFGGAVATWQTLDWQTDAQLQYRRHGSDEGYRPGDLLRLDGSLQYRVLPRSLATSSGFTYAVLEAAWVREARETQGGVRTDTGGTQVLLAPGLQYVSRRSVWEAQWQFPVSENLRSGAMQDDRLIRLSLRWAF
jgi:hypothetical protein